MSKKLVFLLLLLSFLSLPALAHAQDGPIEVYGPTVQGNLDVSKPLVSPGEEIEITGRGFKEGAKVEIYLDGEKISQTTANSRGDAKYDYTIPPETKKGIHSIVMQGSNEQATLVLRKNVVVSPVLKDVGEDVEKVGKSIKTIGKTLKIKEIETAGEVIEALGAFLDIFKKKGVPGRNN